MNADVICLFWWTALAKGLAEGGGSGDAQGARVTQEKKGKNTVRLTVHTDYALRLLISCAANPHELVTIAEVASAYGISKAHLMKIANKLVRAGFLASTRGRKGGLRLAGPAASINIGKVVRLMESQSLLVECYDRATNSCVIAPACSLKHLLAGAEEAFYRHLETASLADIALAPKDVLRFFSRAA